MAEELKSKLGRARVITKTAPFNEKSYTYDDRFIPWDGKDTQSIRSIPDMVKALKEGKAEIDARCMAVKNGEVGFKTIKGRTKFLEALKKNQNRKFKETFDSFAYDGPSGGYNSGNLYGEESIPLIGGPFYKQTYYADYIRMHNLAFYAYHHDPIARLIVHLTRDFTLGRGFRVDIENKVELAVWRAFEEANNVQNVLDQIALEMSIYGETMIWWLPNNQTKIEYRIGQGQESPKGLIPRVRLIDPSVIWDIITFPEDITRVLGYQWIAPTQYQYFTAKDGGESVPGSKFIYQQIPAPQVQHYKINSVSNEKRGRSDLFPVLGYLKRLRDAVNYSIIALQKQSSWAIDTSIDGAPEDLDAYVDDLNASLATPNPGSEFVHSSKVTRQFLSATAGAKGQDAAFEWCLSMIAAGVGIPVSYFGSHMSGGQTRASALVATEPVAKKFEKRQGVYEQIIIGLARKLGIKSQIEVTFPELIVQDRSAKLKDLALASVEGWLAKKRCAEIAAKEFNVTKYDWDQEQADIKAEGQMVNPLTAPPAVAGVASAIARSEQPTPEPKPSAVTSQDRKELTTNERAGHA
jgi:hypothetical protein